MEGYLEILGFNPKGNDCVCWWPVRHWQRSRLNGQTDDQPCRGSCLSDDLFLRSEIGRKPPCNEKTKTDRDCCNAVGMADGSDIC